MAKSTAKAAVTAKGKSAPKAAAGRSAVAGKSGKALSPFEEMDALFDRLSRGLMARMGFPALGELGWPAQLHAPRVDVLDRGKDLLVRAEIPGMNKDDLHISLTDQTVTIRGESHKESKDEKGDYFRREISRGEFQRTLALPVEVQGDKASASFKDGVLELVLPKSDKPASRKILID